MGSTKIIIAFFISCIVITLADSVFGDHVWQDRPLRCNTCQTADCKALVSKKCGDNNAKCVIAVLDSTLSLYGCSDNSTIENYNCTANSCYQCNSNDCNHSGYQKKDLITCLSCDSATDIGCGSYPDVKKTTTCLKSCMVAQYLAREGEQVYETIRGCLSDLDVFDQNDCGTSTDNNKKTCFKCDTENCNKALFPEQWLSCNFCNNQFCNATVERTCPLFEFGDKCFYRHNKDGILAELGCSSLIPKDQLSYLIKFDLLKQCENSNCNILNTTDSNPKPKVKNCTVCDSRISTDCLLNPEKLMPELCVSDNKKCITRGIDNSRIVMRECGDGIFLTTCSGDSCLICEGDSCNNKMFPADRMQCYNCTSETDKDCQKKPSHLQYCENYVKDDACISFVRNNTYFRGCGVDHHCDKNESQKTCITCKGKGCNNQELGGAARIYLETSLAGLLVVSITRGLFI